MMLQFNQRPLGQASASATLPLHKRNPQRITITVNWALYTHLLQRSDHEGRSLSNLAAHLLESSARS
jgi:hypothetical protein